MAKKRLPRTSETDGQQNAEAEHERDKSVGREIDAHDGGESDHIREETVPLQAESPNDRDETGEEKLKRATEEYAAEVSDPEHPLYHNHVLAWYVRTQVQASPLTPAEIADRAGVSISQIYRFLKGERSLTLETADKIMPVVGRSLVEKIRGLQDERKPKPEGVEEGIEDEKERLRRRLEDWERTAFDEARAIMQDLAGLADRMRAMIDDL